MKALMLAFSMLAACSPPATRTIAPGRQATVEGTIFRTQDNGTLVTAQRTMGERTAAGVVLLRGVDLEPAQTSPHVRLAGARAWLALGETLGLTADGYHAAKRGTAELGLDYAKPHVRDETHMRERLAEEELEKHNDPRAAELQIRVLRSRIGMYIERYTREVE